ncbi:unnamed protein product [Vitrella brassicaformis CCMP3155]|uniref:Uncharacterized protein n=1 Tax=Vitrella brassicaformis (strain CCMP3155) TaxID=1169540 RepID=A0A0G4ES14_VITBC|nr:unnamed protein product [Vitrella brassicaformis CCMP3155]|eukprot:CEM01016.1 unnamed protein product [Vitrella brassicaformis CCMP3155]
MGGRPRGRPRGRGRARSRARGRQQPPPKQEWREVVKVVSEEPRTPTGSTTTSTDTNDTVSQFDKNRVESTKVKLTQRSLMICCCDTSTSIRSLLVLGRNYHQHLRKHDHGRRNFFRIPLGDTGMRFSYHYETPAEEEDPVHWCNRYRWLHFIFDGLMTTLDRTALLAVCTSKDFGVPCSTMPNKGKTVWDNLSKKVKEPGTPTGTKTSNTALRLSWGPRRMCVRPRRTSVPTTRVKFNFKQVCFWCGCAGHGYLQCPDFLAKLAAAKPNPNPF